MSYSGVLFGGATSEHLFAIDRPHVEGDALTWRAEPLQVAIELRRRAPPFQQTLIPGVVWHCVMPAADASVHIEDRELRGRGYAELLELTLPPWQLPIDELRWGRFAGQTRSIVWIDWRGAHPLTVVLVDGRPAEGAVREAAVTAGDLSLSIDHDTVIRTAPLSETLSTIPLLAALLPRRFVQANERKWSGLGTVYRDKAIIDRGWVVHERVTFS